jgi:hypothetical protein
MSDWKLKKLLAENVQNKNNPIFKIQALLFNGLQPFFQPIL